MPIFDWNDTEATRARRALNAHTPCYFMAFPPVEGLNVTDRYAGLTYPLGGGRGRPKRRYFDYEGSSWDDPNARDPFRESARVTRVDVTRDVIACLSSEGAALYALSLVMLFLCAVARAAIARARVSRPSRAAPGFVSPPVVP